MNEFAPFLLNHLFWSVTPRQYAAMQIQRCFRDYLEKRRMSKIINTIQSCAKNPYISPINPKKRSSEKTCKKQAGRRRPRRRRRRN